MKQQTSTKTYDKECPKCRAHGYELQTFVKKAGPKAEIVECRICNHQYKVGI